MVQKAEEILAKIAVKEALFLPIGTEFEVSELFSKSDWLLLSYEDREYARTGAWFYKELKKQNLINRFIEIFPYKEGETARYKRIGKTVEETLNSVF